MAEIIWIDEALIDLDQIAAYIAVDNPDAADRLIQRVFRHVEQLEEHPESGSHPLELNDRRYRQIIEPPCRIFYRYDGKTAYVIFVIRGERRLKKSRLKVRDRISKKLS